MSVFRLVDFTVATIAWGASAAVADLNWLKRVLMYTHVRTCYYEYSAEKSACKGIIKCEMGASGEADFSED